MAQRSTSDIRIAVSSDLGGWPVSQEVRQALARTAEILKDSGAHVEEVDLQLPMQKVLRAASIHYTASLNEFDGYMEAHGDQLSAPLLANVAGHRARAAGGTYAESHVLEGEIWLALAAVLERFDVLLCPTMGSGEILADLEYAGSDAVTIDGHEWTDLLEVALTTPFNMLGACPVLSVPSGKDRNGVPMGVQLVGRPYQEEAIFAAAKAIESVARWYSSADARPGELAW